MRHARRGFTLIELLVVIAIILILAAILFPVFAKVRGKALQTTCASNLKQLGVACEMYQAAWGDVLVPFGMPFNDLDHIWYALLDPYLRQIEGGRFNNTNLGKLFRCPAAEEEEIGAWAYQRSYGMNGRVGGATFQSEIDNRTVRTVPASKAKYPSATVRVAESAWDSQGGSGFAPDPTANQPDRYFPGRHNGVGNVLWIDGHVTSMTRQRYEWPGPSTDTNPDKAVWLRLGGPKYTP